MKENNKEEYNIEDYYFKIPEGKKLSRVQESIVLLIHCIFIIGIPVTLISLINNIWIQFFLMILWIHLLDYTSPWIQKNITNKILKWMKIVN